MGKKGWTLKQYEDFLKKKPKYKVVAKRKNGSISAEQVFVLKKNADFYARLLRDKGRKVTVTKLPKV